MIDDIEGVPVQSLVYKSVVLPRSLHYAAAKDAAASAGMTECGTSGSGSARVLSRELPQARHVCDNRALSRMIDTRFT